MAITFKADIPCKPVVRAYMFSQLGKRFNHQPEKHITLDRTTHIGRYFLSLVEKDVKFKDSRRKTSHLTDTVTIRIAENLYLRNGYFMSYTAICDFNAFITAEVHQRLFDIIDAYKEAAETRYYISEAIKNFYRKFDISEQDYSYDAAKKAYQRYQQRAVSANSVAA